MNAIRQKVRPPADRLSDRLPTVFQTVFAGKSPLSIDCRGKVVYNDLKISRTADEKDTEK